MDQAEYQRLQSLLVTYDDIGAVVVDEGIEPEVALIIHTHRVVRDATKRHHIIKRRLPRFLSEWRKGRTLVSLAKQERFPAVLMSQLILLQDGMGRKEFWAAVRDADTIKDKRLRKEIKQVLAVDHIYSPEGNEVQRLRGVKGEDRLVAWLEERDIPFKTEHDLKAEGHSGKTPDFLFEPPITFDGAVIHWIESKANFGDRKEIGRNLRKQLIPYTELWGAGIVVYWFGVVNDGPEHELVTTVDAGFFDIDHDVVLPAGADDQSD